MEPKETCQLPGCQDALDALDYLNAELPEEVREWYTQNQFRRYKEGVSEAGYCSEKTCLVQLQLLGRTGWQGEE